jgi:hypothetical protein
MEKTMNHYAQFVKRLLGRYESLSTEHSRVELLFDDARGHYMAVRLGWSPRKRIHLCLVHIDIRDDLVVIQCNNTEDEVATELVNMGVPAENIRLEFLPPARQEFSLLRDFQSTGESVLAEESSY